MEFLTKQEIRAKNKSCDKFYEVKNSNIAKKIIEMKKWLYFTEEITVKNGRTITAYYFEVDREFYATANKLKKEEREKNERYRKLK